jgi:hypothetical protein
MRRTVVCAVVIGGCLGAGLNQNQQGPGNGDTGVEVGAGDIAVDPTGRWVFYTAGERLHHVDLAGGTRRQVAGVRKPHRFAFGPTGSGVVYVVGETEAGDDVLVAHHVETARTLWSRPVELGYTIEGSTLSVLPWVNPTADGRAVVVTQQKRVEVVGAARGELRHSLALERLVADVDLPPGQDRVLVTETHRWDGDRPATRIHALRLDGGATSSFEVPNCSSELVVTPDARWAFLAPTVCQKDPVSVIDLREDRFVRNLPGFGPVAVAPDGMLAVAFLDATRVEAALFDDPSQIPPADGDRYHLMLVDTTTLAFRTVPLGDALPRYALTPDGHILLVDSPSWVRDGRLRLLDVAGGRLVSLTGTEDVRLESYVVTADATRIYLLYHGLWRVDVDAARLREVPLPFAPLNLNITPDDRRLLLREDADTLWLYDLDRGQLEGSVELDG